VLLIKNCFPEMVRVGTKADGEVEEEEPQAGHGKGKGKKRKGIGRTRR